MAKYTDERDDWEADWDDDPDAPQARDLAAFDDDRDDDYDTITCGSCGSEISELSERCPVCGDWVVERRFSERYRKPVFVVLAVLLLVSFLLWRLYALLAG